MGRSVSVVGVCFVCACVCMCECVCVCVNVCGEGVYGTALDRALSRGFGLLAESHQRWARTDTTSSRTYLESSRVLMSITLQNSEGVF